MCHFIIYYSNMMKDFICVNLLHLRSFNILTLSLLMLSHCLSQADVGQIVVNNAFIFDLTHMSVTCLV